MSYGLKLDTLSCERDSRLLFEHLSLDLSSGSMLQVMGPNGSGKTSLLRILAGLMPPSEGAVRLESNSGSSVMPLNQMLLWMGYATGIKMLLTAEENLSWLCSLHQQPQSQSQIWQALAAVGLRGFEDVPCYSLSAGQQRRVALARLYLNPPPLWILDEPFTALDPQGVTQLEQHLVRHCEAGGLVILTTHHTLTLTPARFTTLALGS
ncbi:cytochrome c biogenesis heme-transporting ATPase CcmA [Azomonas agilis]|uniref:cytochrome c biogenesis heme-transporting ATPase CcmA n=1 Tax=Azomonas agilis TaxID=116849 RepID=UPI00119FFAD5|nr:cytochrome c biogenesis heme-transporting ATPase CcmA [Azomonas agilis]